MIVILYDCSVVLKFNLCLLMELCTINIIVVYISTTVSTTNEKSTFSSLIIIIGT